MTTALATTGRTTLVGKSLDEATKARASARAVFRLEKKRLEHQQVMDYIDRAVSLIVPVITNPVVMWAGAHTLIDYNKAKEQERSGWLGDLAAGFSAGVSGAVLDTAFIAHAFGGPAGIASIIKAVK